MSEILIASSSYDRPTWGPVAERLTRAGWDVTVYEADKVALGSIELSMSVEADGNLEFCYDGRVIDLRNIGAAWYRRSTFISDADANGVTQMGLDIERKALQTAIWDDVADEAWLNSPDRITRASRKIMQLRLAARLGLDVPQTVVTNQWHAVLETLPEQVVCKGSYPLLYDGEDFLSLYTTPFTNSTTGLPTGLNPFPGIWQSRVQKAREWRITVVGDRVFDAAIYASDSAQDDWRRHQMSPADVRFRAEAFPEVQKEKCRQYLGALGLKFGAFDFIESSEGRITFLECNPNGQYMWLEQSLDMPISGAIADELAKTASSSSSIRH